MSNDSNVAGVPHLVRAVRTAGFGATPESPAPKGDHGRRTARRARDAAPSVDIAIERDGVASGDQGQVRVDEHLLINVPNIHPTMAEALKIAAISRCKDPAKLSCCAE